MWFIVDLKVFRKDGKKFGLDGGFRNDNLFFWVCYEIIIIFIINDFSRYIRSCIILGKYWINFIIREYELLLYSRSVILFIKYFFFFVGYKIYRYFRIKIFKRFWNIRKEI